MVYLHFIQNDVILYRIVSAGCNRLMRGGLQAITIGQQLFAPLFDGAKSCCRRDSERLSNWMTDQIYPLPKNKAL